MKLLNNKNILLFLKIILPALICALIIKFFKLDIGYQVLFFGLIIGIFNLRKAKYNNIVSLIFSVGMSYLAFFISIGLYFGIGHVIMQFIELDKLNEVSIYGYNLKNFLMLIPVSILSPILMLLFYKFLFKINNSTYFKSIMWVTIIVLIIYGIIKKDFEDENASVFWQFIMAFVIQLVLNENEIIGLIKNKNTAYNNV